VQNVPEFACFSPFASGFYGLADLGKCQ